MKGRKNLAIKGLIAIAIMAVTDLATVFGFIEMPKYLFLVVIINVIGAIFVFSMFMGLLYYARVARARRVSAEFDEADRIAQERTNPDTENQNQASDAEIQSLYRELVKNITRILHATKKTRLFALI